MSTRKKGRFGKPKKTPYKNAKDYGFPDPVESVTEIDRLLDALANGAKEKKK